MKATQSKQYPEEAAALGFTAKELEEAALSNGINLSDFAAQIRKEILLRDEVLLSAGFIDWEHCSLGHLKAKPLKKKLSDLDKRLRARMTQRERYALYKEIIVLLENDPTLQEGCCIGFDDEFQANDYHNCEMAIAITRRREMEPHAERGKKIAAARPKGTATTKANSKKRKAAFCLTFRRVQNDPECCKWSKDAQIQETIKRFKKAGVQIGKRTAYNYLSPRR